MAVQPRVVALLVASPALGSILSSVLAASPALRVRCFESRVALLAYARLARVDLVVLDFDSEMDPAGEVALALREFGTPGAPRCDIVALSSVATPAMKRRATAAGIAEVIVKPMSPRYLFERVLARLARRPPPPPPAPQRRAPAAPPVYHGGNVIPLFGERPVPS